MVKAINPIKGDIGIATVKLDGSADGATGKGWTEDKEAIEDREILAHIEALSVVGEGNV